MKDISYKFDYLIGLAVLEYGADEAKKFDQIDASGIVIDEKLDKKIYRLIAKKAREPKIKKIKKISFRVAVAAMLIMSIMFIGIMTISSLREALWNAIIKWYDDYVSIAFVQETINPTEALPPQTEPPTEDSAAGVIASPDEVTEQVTEAPTEGVEEVPEVNTPTVVAPTEILEYRKPVVPDTYTEMEWTKDLTYYMLEYYEGETSKFLYWQNVYAGDEQFVDSEGAEVKDVLVGLYRGVFILGAGEDPNTLMWTDGEYLYTITGSLTENEIIEIAKTVK